MSLLCFFCQRFVLFFHTLSNQKIIRFVSLSVIVYSLLRFNCTVCTLDCLPYGVLNLLLVCYIFFSHFLHFSPALCFFAEYFLLSIMRFQFSFNYLQFSFWDRALIF
jgi:hypothetical protein